MTVKHRWTTSDKDFVCRCKHCGKLWSKESREEDCEAQPMTFEEFDEAASRGHS